MSGAESRGQTRDRLKAEGRWKAYLAMVRRLIADGEPQTIAWALATEEFPPLQNNLPPPAAPPADADAADSTPAPVFDGHVPMRETILWVFENVADPNVRSPAQAPSPGAWGLLEWARTNTGLFYKDMATKVLPTKTQLERDDEFEASDRRVDDEITRQLRDIRDASLRAGAERVGSESALSA